MTLQQVLDKYAEHISRIHSKAYYKQGGVRTAAQNKGIAYYTAAANTVQSLIDAPRPAWYDLHFTNPKRLR
jgi:hypothetical protein